MTLKSPIFRKLFLSACLLVGAPLFVLDFYLTRYMARRQVESVEQRLAAQARILSAEAADVPAAELEGWARAAGERAQSRLTIIDPQGLVLADSQHDPESMENHAARPEVREARRSGKIGRAHV